MFHFLGFLFVIIIAVIIIGLSVVGSIFRALFGFGRRTTQTGHTRQSRTDASQSTEGESTDGSSHKRPKIFDKEDGEYVDFEEIKE